MWFYQHVPNVNAPGIASVYLQCIGQPNAKRRECRARAEWFGEEARSELIRGWPLVALGPILVVWPLIHVLVWTGRWIRRGFRRTA
jgi:hypothetical protein